ncbi:hypothetical protein RvY_15772-1 [Ramazzottius varieornatus]|uniref:Uncharacterized protein n=1 Tax=Ramazzottius varieornatus TaxID=947166 RepID=A0A1D1W3X8_RAMVA|nr:hypothetical protein RvY_15772-1 [Ramazzottius varieornatus]
MGAAVPLPTSVAIPRCQSMLENVSMFMRCLTRSIQVINHNVESSQKEIIWKKLFNRGTGTEAACGSARACSVLQLLKHEQSFAPVNFIRKTLILLLCSSFSHVSLNYSMLLCRGEARRLRTPDEYSAVTL